MKSRIFCLAASLLCVAPWQASAQTLSVGDNAPAIEVSKWAKGDKIDRLEADRTYVVEFWATWCGPCRTSIPHLTELQKKYKDKGIQFLGVSVWEQDQSKVAPFVKDMGDKMDYSVALDDVPDGVKGGKGKMAESWMTASGSNGIPTAFIVTKGKVAWIGHPMQMDAPLAKVVSGNYDLAKAASEYREEKATEQKMMTVLDKLRSLGRNASDKERLAVFDAAIAETPSLEKALGLQKYLLMSQTGDEAASTYGAKLVDGVLKDEAEALNQLAWAIVDPASKREASRRDYKLARKAAIRADELTHGENGPILDTLAIALFETGDTAKALEAQEKAVKLMGDSDAGVKERLEKYRKAVGEKKP
jgi:thiol-disulfide isomerase/thioredoxin